MPSTDWRQSTGPSRKMWNSAWARHPSSRKQGRYHYAPQANPTLRLQRSTVEFYMADDGGCGPFGVRGDRVVEMEVEDLEGGVKSSSATKPILSL
jgi:hypothetical protein